jgi:uncharacterized protein (TIGR02996 family)
VDRKAFAAALERSDLLAAWALVPAAEVAAAIEKLPSAIGGELAEVVAADAAAALARLNRIATPRDPRTAATLGAWLVDPPWHATGAKPFYKVVFERLDAQRDPRSIDVLKKASRAVAKAIKGESMRTWMLEKLEKARASLESAHPDGVPSISAGERAALKKARPVAEAPKKVTGRGKAEVELLAAIRANPADDGARQVYADVLVERGDPRGLFINMQLARAGRDPAGAERAAEMKLLVKHARVWLGDVAGFCGSFSFRLEVGPTTSHRGRVRFERGFLASCWITGSPKRLATLAGTSDLATVEDMHYWGTETTLLARTPLPALRDLGILDALVPTLAVAPCAKQLSTLRIRCMGKTDLERDLAACAAMPALRELDIVSADGTDGATEIARAALALPNLQRVTVGTANRVEFSRDGGQWTARVVKGATRRCTRLLALCP